MKTSILTFLLSRWRGKYKEIHNFYSQGLINIIKQKLTLLYNNTVFSLPSESRDKILLRCIWEGPFP